VRLADSRINLVFNRGLDLALAVDAPKPESTANR
jgi:hypothetical protein